MDDLLHLPIFRSLPMHSVEGEVPIGTEGEAFDAFMHGDDLLELADGVGPAQSGMPLADLWPSAPLRRAFIDVLPQDMPQQQAGGGIPVPAQVNADMLGAAEVIDGLGAQMVAKPELAVKAAVLVLPQAPVMAAPSPAEVLDALTKDHVPLAPRSTPTEDAPVQVGAGTAQHFQETSLAPNAPDGSAPPSRRYVEAEALPVVQPATRLSPAPATPAPAQYDPGQPAAGIDQAPRIQQPLPRFAPVVPAPSPSNPQAQQIDTAQVQVTAQQTQRAGGPVSNDGGIAAPARPTPASPAHASPNERPASIALPRSHLRSIGETNLNHNESPRPSTPFATSGAKSPNAWSAGMEKAISFVPQASMEPRVSPVFQAAQTMDAPDLPPHIAVPDTPQTPGLRIHEEVSAPTEARPTGNRRPPVSHRMTERLPDPEPPTSVQGPARSSVEPVRVAWPTPPEASGSNTTVSTSLTPPVTGFDRVGANAPSNQRQMPDMPSVTNNLPLPPQGGRGDVVANRTQNHPTTQPIPEFGQPESQQQEVPAARHRPDADARLKAGSDTRLMAAPGTAEAPIGGDALPPNRDARAKPTDADLPVPDVRVSTDAAPRNSTPQHSTASVPTIGPPDTPKSVPGPSFGEAATPMPDAIGPGAPVSATLPSAVSPIGQSAPVLASSIAQQVVVTVQNGGVEPGGPVDIALDPPELGRLRMSVGENAGTLVLTITAERPETADLMRRHFNLLAEEFSRAGLDAPQVNISHDRSGGRDTPDPPGSDRQADGHSGDDQPTDQPSALSPDKSPRGGLDLRI